MPKEALEKQTMAPEAKWINWLRSSSQLVAGIKITIAFLSYMGIGQFGKWLFETFYPFTRIMWGDLLSWLSLPDISNLEKDALTAMLFFLPLGISALFSAFNGRYSDDVSNEHFRSDRRTAVIFGVIFFFLICGGLVRGAVG